MSNVFLRSALLAVFTSGCISANAQLSVGPEAGLNISSISGTADGYTSCTGGRLGLSTNFKLSGDLYLQPGLFYSSKGGHTVTTSNQNLALLAALAGVGDITSALGNTSQWTTLKVTNNISYALNYLQLPVLAVYKFKAGPSGQLFAGVGPYASYLLDGRYKKSSISSIAGVSINSNEDRAVIKDEDIASFDFGLNVNLGYEHASGFFCRGFYETGLMDNNIGKNTSFGLSIGYFFSGEKTGNQ